MSFELPLFPLNVVLFPGMPLPLHIFEPRYRLMISRCLAGDRLFGVAVIVDGEEGQSDTVPAPIGCSAEIVDATQLDDGRYNLETTGRRRFRLLGAREEDGYLVGTVEWIDDLPLEAEAPVLANRALRSLRRYLGAIGTNLAETGGNMKVPDNVHDISMWIATLLAVPNSQKQELLEMESTAARLDREVALLRRAEVVQEAWTRRQGWDLPDELDDTSDSYAQFSSLN